MHSPSKSIYLRSSDSDVGCKHLVIEEPRTVRDDDFDLLIADRDTRTGPKSTTTTLALYGHVVAETTTRARTVPNRAFAVARAAGHRLGS